jgi:uracil-DNA glycosylase family 4
MPLNISSLAARQAAAAQAAQQQRDQNMPELAVCRNRRDRPRLIVALGATAAQSLAGQAIPVQANRGKILDGTNGLRIFVTIHPSALLRLRDEEEKRSGYESFVKDLRSIERLVAPPASHENPDVRKAG